LRAVSRAACAAGKTSVRPSVRLSVSPRQQVELSAAAAAAAAAASMPLSAPAQQRASRWQSISMTNELT